MRYGIAALSKGAAGFDYLPTVSPRVQRRHSPALAGGHAEVGACRAPDRRPRSGVGVRLERRRGESRALTILRIQIRAGSSTKWYSSAAPTTATASTPTTDQLRRPARREDDLELRRGPVPRRVHQLVHHVQAERDVPAVHHYSGGQQPRQAADSDRQRHDQRHEQHVDEPARVVDLGAAGCASKR